MRVNSIQLRFPKLASATVGLKYLSEVTIDWLEKWWEQFQLLSHDPVWYLFLPLVLLDWLKTGVAGLCGAGCARPHVGLGAHDPMWGLWTLLPKERHDISLSGCGSNTQPSNWEAITLPLSYRHPQSRYWSRCLVTEAFVDLKPAIHDFVFFHPLFPHRWFLPSSVCWNTPITSALLKRARDVTDTFVTNFIVTSYLRVAEQPVPANDPFPALRPSMVQMRQTVSDDQRNRRVGLWVRTQIDQQYDSDPPMG